MWRLARLGFWAIGFACAPNRDGTECPPAAIGFATAPNRNRPSFGVRTPSMNLRRFAIECSTSWLFNRRQ
ncbi:hypothetical protein [Scytonema sp. PCC 10023]|uniref:hypothetical protein n=1 Tax=Scytonema sp. PCC 10023 TaxID=1680591 RepID=UPI0039C62BE8